MRHHTYGMLSLLCVVLLLISDPAWGQETDAIDTTTVLTLPVLLDELQATHPALQAAALHIQRLDYTPTSAAAWPDPVFRVTYQPAAVLTARGAQRSSWSLAQTIPFPGKTRLRGSIAELDAEMADSDRTNLERELYLQAKRAYYNLYGVQQETQIVEAYYTRLRDFEAAATSRYEVGLGPQQAILRAQLEFHTHRQHLLRLEARRSTVVQSIARLLNRPVSDTLQLASPDVQEPIIPNAETALDMAIQNRPDLARLRLAKQQADHRIELAQKEFLPDFGINLTYFDIASSDLLPTANGSDALMIGTEVRIPLWRDRLHANLEEARLQRRRFDAVEDDLALQIRTRLQDLIQQLEQEREMLLLYRETLLPQAALTVESALTAYTTGQINFQDMLEAERMRFNLELEYQKTRTQHLLTQAELEYELGIGLASVQP